MDTQYSHQFIAVCKRCREIIAAIPDDLSRTHETAEQIDDWREAGYLVSKVTRTYVMARMSSRGCTCAKVTS